MQGFVDLQRTGNMLADSRVGQKKGDEIPLKILNREVILNIHNMYTSCPNILAATNFLKKEVLRDGVSISQNSPSKRMDKIDVSITEKHLRLFIDQVFDWYFMFGFFPYKIKKMENGVKLPYIPNVTTGNFYVALDSMLQSQLFFVASAIYTQKTPDLTNKEKFLEYVKETGYRVYVFPGHEIDFNFLRINSIIMRLFKTNSELSEHKENMMVSDFNAAHPLFFIERPLEKFDIENYTEAQLITGTTKDFQDGPDFKRKEALERIYMSKIKNIETAIKEGIEENMVKQISNKSGAKEELNRRSSVLKQMPEGHKVSTSGAHAHRILLSVSELTNLYQREIASVFEVPFTFVFGDKLSTRTSDSDNQIELMERTIKNIRSILNDMYQFIHYHMYGQEIDESFKQDFEKITNIKNDILTSELDEDKKREKLKRASSLHKKIDKEFENAQITPILSLKFNEEKKVDTSTLALVMQAHSSGLLDDDKAGYLIQKGLGLMDIPEEEFASFRSSKLAKNVKKRKTEKEDPEKEKKGDQNN